MEKARGAVWPIDLPDRVAVLGCVCDCRCDDPNVMYLRHNCGKMLIDSVCHDDGTGWLVNAAG